MRCRLLDLLCGVGRASVTVTVPATWLASANNITTSLIGTTLGVDSAAVVNATLTIASSSWPVPVSANATGRRLPDTNVGGGFVWNANASWANQSAQLTFTVVPSLSAVGLCDSDIEGLLLSDGGAWAQQPSVTRVPGAARGAPERILCGPRRLTCQTFRLVDTHKAYIWQSGAAC